LNDNHHEKEIIVKVKIIKALGVVLFASVMLVAGCSKDAGEEEKDASVADEQKSTQTESTAITIKPFELKEASWKNRETIQESFLQIKGRGEDGIEIAIVPVRDTSIVIGKAIPEKNKWGIKISGKDLKFTPCRVRAVKPDGKWEEIKVDQAPEDCDVDYSG
jgi:hypothetical protein